MISRNFKKIQVNCVRSPKAKEFLDIQKSSTNCTHTLRNILQNARRKSEIFNQLEIQDSSMKFRMTLKMFNHS